MRSHYETMGVPRTFTANELKAKWQELSRLHHPDRGGDAAIFTEISRAYAVLRDLKSRHAYDAAQDLFTDLCYCCNGEGRTYTQKGFTNRIAVLCAKCNGSGRLAR